MNQDFLGLRRVFLCLVAFVALAKSISVLADERFILEIPGNPDSRSTAVTTRRTITITDGAGEQFVYVARPDADSRDGDFLGFYCAEARRFLRWPADGDGPMYLGTAEGEGVIWRRSQMRVRHVEGGLRPDLFERSHIDRRDGGSVPARSFGGSGWANGRTHITALPMGNENFAAYFNSTGALQMFVNRDERWQQLENTTPHRGRSGAPLVMLEDSRHDIPSIFLINERGALEVIENGRTTRTIGGARAPRFIPSGHVGLLRRGPDSLLLAVDGLGRLWTWDPASEAFDLVESREGLLEPGAPIAACSAIDDVVFVVDRRGHLLGYKLRGARWSAPFHVASGLASGSGLSAIRHAGMIHVSAVDARGRLHIWTADDDEWDDDVCSAARFVPGSAVSLAMFRDQLAALAVTADGSWVEVFRNDDRWAMQAIADGFVPGTDLVWLHDDRYALALDRSGRLVSARHRRERWECSLCIPGLNHAPRLVRRTIVPNEPLPAAAVEFENRYTEELVVRLFDLRSGRAPVEFTIPPGDTVIQRIARDAGAVMEEVYEVPDGAGDLVEEVRRHRLPSRGYYNVVVYANRVASVYFDRTKNKTAKPDEINMAHVSLGVFPLPAGELLNDGDRLDVYREAAARHNPGAAALVDPRQP